MLLFSGALGVIAFGVWVFCIIDVITTPPPRVRNLPKLVWVLLVILLVDIGSIAWLIAGRPWTQKVPVAAGAGARGSRPKARPTNPDDDEEFLAGLSARAEEQRRRAREADEDGSGNA